MSKEEFQAERMYQISLFLIKSMWKKDVISKSEFDEINTKLLEKYQPILGTLLAGKDRISL